MGIVRPGNVAVVTGSAHGLGFGIARAAAERGMKVMLSDLDGDGLGRAVETLRSEGFTVEGTAANVADRDAVKVLAAATLGVFGKVDLLCNNAGIAGRGAVTELTDADWDRMLAVNLFGPLNGIAAFLPIMQQQGYGHINTTASVNSFHCDPQQAHYNVSKFAVLGLIESLQVELRAAESPVTASVLCPGPIATDIMKRAIGGDPEGAEADHEMLAKGMAPDVAGRLAVSEIEAGRFWIFTHPVMVETTFRTKFEALSDDGAYPAGLDWPWEDLLS